MFVFNVHNGTAETSYNVHHAAIKSIRPSKDRLMLTSAAYVKPFSILWRMEENGIQTRERLIDFNEEDYCEFGNLSTSQIVTTQGPRATVSLFYICLISTPL